MERLGWKHYHSRQNPCHNNKEPHAIPCMPNLARKVHMKIDTSKEYCRSCLILLFLTYSFLPLAFFCFLDPTPKFSKKILSFQEWEIERERERIMRELHNWTKKRLETDLQKPFLSIIPLFSSFLIIFLQFLPHMQPMTFHLPFLLISIIFINKCAKNSTFPFQILFHCLCQFP